MLYGIIERTLTFKILKEFITNNQINRQLMKPIRTLYKRWEKSSPENVIKFDGNEAFIYSQPQSHFL